MSLGTRVITTYSDPGTGKSADAYRCLPNAVKVCKPGALDVALHTLGLETDPTHLRHATDLEGATKTFMALRKSFPDDAWGVIGDDVGVWAKRTHDRMRESGAYPESGDGVFRFWRDLGTKIMNCHNAGVDLAEHISHTRGVDGITFFTAHERKFDTKDAVKGGPWFPSKTLTVEWVKACHVVYRVAKDESRKTEWKAVYQCEHLHPYFLMKSRNGVEGKKNPANAGEILRLTGYEIPYPWGMEWMGEWVQAFCDEILAGKAYAAVRKDFNKRLADCDMRHVRWIAQDGYDRAQLTLHYRKTLAEG